MLATLLVLVSCVFGTRPDLSAQERLAVRFAPTGSPSDEGRILDYLASAFEPVQVEVPADGLDLVSLLRRLCGGARKNLVDRLRAMNPTVAYPLAKGKGTVSVPPCPSWVEDADAKVPPSGRVADAALLAMGTAGEATLARIRTLNENLGRRGLEAAAPGDVIRLPYSTQSVSYVLKHNLRTSVPSVIQQIQRLPGLISVTVDPGISLVRPVSLQSATVSGCDPNTPIPNWPFSTPALLELLRRNDNLTPWGTPLPVTVAVADTGVPLNEKRLKYETNRYEERGIAGIDDDGNGYSDDTFGANMNRRDSMASFPTHPDGAHGTAVAALAQGALPTPLANVVTERIKLKILNLVERTVLATAPPIEQFLLPVDAVGSVLQYVNYPTTLAPIVNMSVASNKPIGELESRLPLVHTLLVVAAGNDGKNLDNNPVYPASYSASNSHRDRVITVGAHGPSGDLTQFSNFGKGSVDLVAPGYAVPSFGLSNSEVMCSGTSIAAPLVTFTAALLHSLGLPPNRIKNRILETVDVTPELRQKVASGGRLNILKALSLFDDVVETQVAGQPVLLRGTLIEPKAIEVNGEVIPLELIPDPPPGTPAPGRVRRILPALGPETRVSVQRSGGRIEHIPWRPPAEMQLRLLTEANEVKEFTLSQVRDVITHSLRPKSGAGPQPPPPVAMRPAEVRPKNDTGSSRVSLVHRFGGDPAQCRGAFHGEDRAALGNWTNEVRIDTDSRPGSCTQEFAILDPDEELKGLILSITFWADDDPGQCGNPGERIVPLSRDGGQLVYSRPMILDTDWRRGGCQQRFSISGRPDVALEVEFRADGDTGQCGRVGRHRATEGQPVQLRIDTDDRPGGCRQRFRLLLDSAV
jgi:hypothetical protein